MEGLYLTDAETAVRTAREILSHAQTTGDTALIASCRMELGRSFRQKPELVESVDFQLTIDSYRRNKQSAPLTNPSTNKSLSVG